MKLVEKFLLLVLISFLPTAYGQECPANVEVQVNGFASGVKPFNIRNLGCLPGTAGDFNMVSTANKVVLTVTCPSGVDGCLVLSGDINDYFGSPKSAAEAQTFFNGLSLRSKDYMAVIATLTISGTYTGFVVDDMDPLNPMTSRGVFRAADTYVLTLDYDSPPELTDSTIKTVNNLGYKIFENINVTDTETVSTTETLVDEVITSVRMTQTCQFSHGMDTDDCLDFGSGIATFPSLGADMRSVTATQTFLRGLQASISYKGSEISGSDIPTSARLSLTLVSGLKPKGAGTDESLGRVTDTNTLDHELSFAIRGIPPTLDDPNTEQTIFRTGKRVFSSIRVIGGGSRGETVTGIVITQKCEGQTTCVRMEPPLSSFTGTVAQVEEFLRGIAVAPISDDVQSATLAVTVSVLPVGDPNIGSNELEYRLTFMSGVPTLSDDSTSREGDVLGFSPFSSVRVTDPGEADTITSVVI